MTRVTGVSPCRAGSACSTPQLVELDLQPGPEEEEGEADEGEELAYLQLAHRPRAFDWEPKVTRAGGTATESAKATVW